MVVEPIRVTYLISNIIMFIFLAQVWLTGAGPDMKEAARLNWLSHVPATELVRLTDSTVGVAMGRYIFQKCLISHLSGWFLKI
jgi:hypothetical protein